MTDLKKHEKELQKIFDKLPTQTEDEIKKQCRVINEKKAKAALNEAVEFTRVMILINDEIGFKEDLGAKYKSAEAFLQSVYPENMESSESFEKGNFWQNQIDTKAVCGQIKKMLSPDYQLPDVTEKKDNEVFRALWALGVFYRLPLKVNLATYLKIDFIFFELYSLIHTFCIVYMDKLGDRFKLYKTKRTKNTSRTNKQYKAINKIDERLKVDPDWWVKNPTWTEKARSLRKLDKAPENAQKSYERSVKYYAATLLSKIIITRHSGSRYYK